MLNWLKGLFRKSTEEYKYYIKIGNATFGYNSANDVAIAYLFLTSNSEDEEIKIVIREGKYKEIETTLARITASEKNEVTEILNDIDSKKEKLKPEIEGQLDIEDLEM